MVPSVPNPVPSKATASRGSPSRRCSASSDIAWAWWCCTASSRPPWRCAHRVVAYCGCASHAMTTSGTLPVMKARWSTAAAKQRLSARVGHVAEVRRHVRGHRNAIRQNVVFRSPPVARTRAVGRRRSRAGPAAARSHGIGAAAVRASVGVDADAPSPRRARGWGGRGSSTPSARPSIHSRSRVAVHDRRAALVGRGHDQRGQVERGEEQVVHRRVGEHHPDVAQVRRHRVAHRARSGRQQHDGRGGRGQRPLRRVVDHADPAGVLHVGDHHGEGLGGPVLPLPQPRHRVVVVRAARQVVAADTLDRDDQAVPQRGGGGIERRAAGVRAAPRQPRPAVAGTRWSGRGSAGRRGRCTPRRRPRTWRSPPSWWPAGRRADR